MEAFCDIATEQVTPALWTEGGFRVSAGWFGPDDRPRFGWLYRPERSGASTGLVIVPPFGRDDICAHRTLRHLAEAGARSGFITLRFDLDGCGDSAGDDSDPQRVESWISSVLDACNRVREAGAKRLVLGGIRLGATLAALAAQQRDDVAGLVAFNAVIRGKTWLHELRAFEMAMNLPPSPAARDEGGQEACGFLLDSETCKTLQAIDLTRSTVPAPRVWVLERDDLPDSGTWPAHLEGLGCQVVRRRIPGYIEMMADPHLGQVAGAFVDACLGYARAISVPEPIRSEAPAPQLRESIALRIGDAWIKETAVSPGAGIFGILAEPACPGMERAMIVLNAGAVRHIGVGRFDVGFSRQLAASGLQVLRVDLTGIGDSSAREGATENTIYGPHDVECVGVCVNWLRARGVRELIVGGMCSGASHALRAAMAGQSIDVACLVNCGVFTAKAGLDSGIDRRFDDIAHYNRSIKSMRAWRKLLSGGVDLRRIGRVAAWKMALQGKRWAWETARRIGFPMRHDLCRDFAALARRGVKVHFLYAGNDPGLLRLAVEAGSSIQKYCRTERFSMRIFAGANHTFTQRWAQAALRSALWEILLPATNRPAEPTREAARDGRALRSEEVEGLARIATPLAALAQPALSLPKGSARAE